MSWRDTITKDNSPEPIKKSSWRDTITKEPSKTESVVRGGVQGATLGLSDEIVGVAKGLLAGFNKKVSDLSKGPADPGDATTAETFSRAYTEGRDEDRAANKAAEQANPKSYLAGQIGGSALSLLVPGGVAARTGTTLAKAGSAAGRAAVEGGVGGFGFSEAKGMGLVDDTLAGAALGGVIGGSIPLVGAAGKKTLDAAGRIPGADRAKEALAAFRSSKSIKPIEPIKPDATSQQVKERLEALGKEAAKKFNKEALDEARKDLLVSGALTAGGAMSGPVGATVGSMLGKKPLLKAATDVAKIETKVAKDIAKKKGSVGALIGSLDKLQMSPGAKPKAVLEVVNEFKGSAIAPEEIHFKILDPETSKPIGQAQVWKADPKSVNELGRTGYSLKDIRIDKDAQGKGIATEVIDSLTDRFGELASDTRGNINEAGKKLFKKLGEEQPDGSFIIKPKAQKLNPKSLEPTERDAIDILDELMSGKKKGRTFIQKPASELDKKMSVLADSLAEKKVLSTPKKWTDQDLFDMADDLLNPGLPGDDPVYAEKWRRWQTYTSMAEVPLDERDAFLVNNWHRVNTTFKDFIPVKPDTPKPKPKKKKQL